MYLPIIMGIATREEVEVMTAYEIGLAYHLAKMKQEALKGSGGVDV